MNLRNLHTRSPLAISLLCLFLSACGNKYITQPPTIEDTPPLLDGSQPAPPTLPEPQRLPQRPNIQPSAATPPPLSSQSLPAVVELRDQAAVASSANDHPRAIGLLERALRIAPDDPQTFYDLARNHLAMNQPQQALQLARRGLTLNPTSGQRVALEELVARSQASL